MSNYSREILSKIATYIPGKPIEEVQKELNLKKIIKLASNENPLGSSPKAVKAIINQTEKTSYYPDSNFSELRERLSYKLNIEPNQLFFGAGSDGIIEMIPHAFINPNEEVIMANPSFPLYKNNTIIAQGNCIEIPLDKEYRFDLNTMLESITDKTKLIWLCNPNNPTGTMYTDKEQFQFIKNVPKNILIIIDEAYYEYVTRNDYPESVNLLKEHNNIIILRTFSKIYGLASLRIGYAISNTELISDLEKVRSPFNVSSFAQVAALACLDDDEFKNTTYNINRENKEYLYTCFKQLGLDYLPTETNFIMVNVKQNSLDVFDKLLKEGIIVRPGYNYGMKNWLRVTIGTKEECLIFIEKLKEVL